MRVTARADRWPVEYRARKFAEAHRAYMDAVQPLLREKAMICALRSTFSEGPEMRVEHHFTDEQKALIAALNDMIVSVQRQCFADFLT